MKFNLTNIFLFIIIILLTFILFSKDLNFLSGLKNNNSFTSVKDLPVTATPYPTGQTEGPDKNWYISPEGNDSNKGDSATSPFKTIQTAVDRANPGDTINLLPGEYMQDFVSKRNGTKTEPITISGTNQSIIKGGGAARIIEINHDYITLRGFTVDGLYGDPSTQDGYRDKLIYVQGKQEYDGVTGLRVLYTTLKNAGGECMRLRYFVTQSELAYNTIQSCGHFDYSFDDGGKNGEGIYIGTAPEQRNDGKNPTSDTDESNANLVHHNTFDTQGNECVDIKEDSKYNVVEHNSCTGQKDPESGGMDSRGGYNIFRNNEIFGNLGAGVRLGGDTVDQNINNDVYDNVIRDNASGGIKFMTTPQGKICGNTMSGNAKGDAVGEYGEEFDPVKSCE